jgi:hypothetical protein
MLEYIMFIYTQNDLNRFDSKCEKTAGGCWLWSSQLREGYGIFWLNNTVVSAHRFSYSIKNEIPKGGWVIHTCNNKRCVNPDHLAIKLAKESFPKMQTKLSDKDIAEIRRALKERSYHGQIKDLSIKYKVSHATISRIKHNAYGR